MTNKTLKQPEALRCAEMLEIHGMKECAAELRRLREVNVMLLDIVDRLEFSCEGAIKRYPSEGEVNAAIAKSTGEQA